MIIVTDISPFAEDAPGLALVRVVGTSSRENTSLWTRGRCRKTHTCVRCRNGISKGELAYRTVLNTDYRMVRLCESCVDAKVLTRIAFCEMCETVEDVSEVDNDCHSCGHGIYEEMMLKPCALDDCLDDNHHYGLGKHLIEV